MISIVNNINNIQVNQENEIKLFPKNTCKIELRKGKVIIRDIIESSGNTITLDFSDVNDPVETNNTALALTLIGFLSTGIGADVVSALGSLSINIDPPNADSALLPAAIALNITTSTLISAADSDRIYFHVCNSDSQKACWIKLQAADVDNDMKGIFLATQGNTDSHFSMDSSIYRGEISAIAETGTPTVNITSF